MKRNRNKQFLAAALAFCMTLSCVGSIPLVANAAGITLNRVKSDAVEVPKVGRDNITQEKKGSKVTVTVNSGTASYGQLSKNEAGYGQSTMGNVVSKFHDQQTSPRGQALPASTSDLDDPNITYQKAIKLPATGEQQQYLDANVTLNYDNVGKIGNRAVGIKVTFSNLHTNYSAPLFGANRRAVYQKIWELWPGGTVRLNDANAVAFTNWFRSAFPGSPQQSDGDIQYALSVFATELSSAGNLTIDRPMGDIPYIVYTNCLYEGFYYRNIDSADVKYEAYYADNGQAVSLLNGLMTINSMNGPKGADSNYREGLYSNDIREAYVREDTNVVLSERNGISGLVGNSVDGWKDELIDKSFTKNSATVRSVSSAPTYTVATNMGVYWWSLTFGTFFANLPGPIKVGLTPAGKEVSKFGHVSAGDTLTYKIKQPVSTLGISAAQGYTSLSITDVLPKEVTYKSAFIRAVSATGAILLDSLPSSAAAITQEGQRITATFNPDYLRVVESPKITENMLYQGETYELIVTTTANETMTLDVFKNQGYTIVNGQQVDVEPVPATPEPAHLKLDKSASKYEWRVGDTVKYTVTAKNVKVNGCGNPAKGVTISDISLPEGLAIASASDVKVTAPAGTKTSVQKSGNGWRVTADKLGVEGSVGITFMCKAQESVNGKEIVNTAKAKASNSEEVTDMAEVYVNEAKLEIQKDVSAYEWRVGDTVDYTVSVKNTNAGTIAKDVVVSDVSLPEGLTLAADPTIEGIPATVNYPIAGTGSKHNETETKQVISSVEKKEGGWQMKVSLLPANVPVTIRFRCVAGEKVNGTEVINTVKTTASNVRATVKDTAKIWVNSPGLHIEKTCDTKHGKVGDILTYTLLIDNQKPGTLARNVVITDQLLTEGVKLQKNSVVLMDSNGDIIKDADITIKGNDFQIKTNRNLVNDKNYSIIDQENGDPKDAGKPNPKNITTETSFTVEYQVKITAEELEAQEVKNLSTVTSDEGTKDEDDNSVQLGGPILDVVKESGKSEYTAGESGKYTVTVRQIREGMTAKNVVITDAFTEEGMEIQEDSMTVKVNGEKVTPISITFNEKKNGFVIETGVNLTDADKLVLNYQVLFKEVAVGNTYRNKVTAKGENTNTPSDENEIQIITIDPSLRINKTVQNKVASVGDSNTYTLKVTQGIERAAANNIVITDSLNHAGVEYAKDSLKVVETEGKDITGECEIEFQEQTFVIRTGRNLSHGESITVIYNVLYKDNGLSGRTVYNTAISKADNASEAEAEAEVDIVDPELTVKKKASTETTNVGDIVAYTVEVGQNEKKTTARNVCIRDQFQTEGVEIDAASIRLYGPTGEDITKEVDIEVDATSYQIKTGRDLSYQETLTVTYDVLYKDNGLAGEKVSNIALATAENAKEAKAQADVKTLLPRLSIEKTASKESAKVGDVVAYTIVVSQETEHAVARNVCIRDKFQIEGVEIDAAFIQLYDPDGDEITKGVDIKADATGYQIETSCNLAYQETLTVTYQALMKEESLKDQVVINIAEAKADNGYGKAEQETDTWLVKDQVDLPVLGNNPVLNLEKTVDKETAKAGDIVVYTLRVTQINENKTASQVVITDELDGRGVEIQKGTIQLWEREGEELHPVKLDEKSLNAEKYGFTIKTGIDLVYGKELFVTYEALVRERAVGKVTDNIAEAKAENAEKVRDTAAVKGEEEESTIADIVKTGLQNHAPLFMLVGFLLLLVAVYAYRKKNREVHNGKI